MRSGHDMAAALGGSWLRPWTSSPCEKLAAQSHQLRRRSSVARSTARTRSMNRQRHRSALTRPLSWTNDGSGPTRGDVDSTFYEACLRHDFGARNLEPHGLGYDPSGRDPSWLTILNGSRRLAM
jgi:hypothetical protein